MSFLWNHSGEVGRLAQIILKAENKSKQDVDDVLTAGLLHDCGKLVFAANMGAKYAEVLKQSKESAEPVETAEHEAFGATHAEMGAYLLGIWGLPDAIVEAVAFHHNPADFPHQGCTSLTAVHVADCFFKDRDGSTVNQIYLEKTGMADRLPIWVSLMQVNQGE